MPELKEVRQAFPLTNERVSLFVLFRSPTDQTRATHISLGNCFTQSTDADVNLIQKYPHKHKMFDKITGNLVAQSSGHIKFNYHLLTWHPHVSPKLIIFK